MSKKKSNGKPPHRWEKKPGCAYQKALASRKTGIKVKAKKIGDAYDWSHLQPRVRLKRELFVREYMKDFNAVAACQRLGWTYAFPSVVANSFLREDYTQWFLQKCIDEIDEDSIVTRNRIQAGLLKETEGEDREGRTARITAWRVLAKIKGMEKTVVEGNLTTDGGVMELPFYPNEEEYKKKTREDQAALKRAVRE